MKKDLFLSVVIPAYNEEGSLKKLCNQIISVIKPLDITFEIIFVNDGSKDKTKIVLEQICKKQSFVKIINFRSNFGKAIALQAGFDFAKGKIIITLDADLQDDPAEIPHFIQKINTGYGLVCGWKQNRKDGFIKNKSSIFFNLVTRRLSGVNLHDFNCGFKGYQSQVAKGLNLRGGLHRFIPVIADSQGYSIVEQPINHRIREYGRTKYGPIRFINGFLDLIIVLYITRFKFRPLQFFSYTGLIIFLIGLSLVFYNPILGIILSLLGLQTGIIGLVGKQTLNLMFKKEHHYDIPKSN